MRQTNDYSEPLLTAALVRRRGLKAESTPPATFNINVGNFRLTDGARATLSKIRGIKNGYRLDAAIAGLRFGQRSIYETIPVEGLKKNSLKSQRTTPSPTGCDIHGLKSNSCRLR